MSTELRTIKSEVNEELDVVSFFGGTDRKQCVQLTQWNKHNDRFEFVQLTRKQAIELAKTLIDFI